MLNVYLIGEDLYAATSVEQATALDHEYWDTDTDRDVHQLDDGDLDIPRPDVDLDLNQTGRLTTLRTMLADHGDEPGWLAKA